MKRNGFGDPLPYGFDEIIEALDEKGWDPSECLVTVEHIDEEAPFGGWSAEISGEDDVVSTLGYESKDELLKDLQACRFRGTQFR